MERVYIDTALLAVPNYAVSEDQALTLVDRVVYFGRLIEPDIPLDFIISSESEELLWSQNCGPSYDELSQFLDLMNLSAVFSAGDLARIYNGIFDRSARSGDCCPVEILSASKFEIDPPLPHPISPVFLVPETQRILSTLATLDSLGYTWFLGSSICGHPVTYSVAGIAELITGLDAELPGEVPFIFAGEVSTFCHLSDLVRADLGSSLWDRATTNAELCFAIAIGALNLIFKGTGAFDVEDLCKFSVGNAFFGSLMANQAGPCERYSLPAYTLCCQIVARSCSRRVGRMGRPAQTVRADDKATGWRVHVTKGHEGLRLMFWETDDGKIEFANIGPKRELVIETGIMGASCQIELSDLI